MYWIQLPKSEMFVNLMQVSWFNPKLKIMWMTDGDSVMIKDEEDVEYMTKELYALSLHNEE